MRAVKTICVGLILAALVGCCSKPEEKEGRTELIAGNEEFKVYRVHKPGLRSLTIVVDKNGTVTPVPE